MVLNRKKNEYRTRDVVRDIRPMYIRFGEWLQRPEISLGVCVAGASCFHFAPAMVSYIDLVLIAYALFFWWLRTRDNTLPAKLPSDSPHLDRNNMGPGKTGKPEGILYLGNEQDTAEELWFSNSDARTHILYLGTTGSGKTEGLKSLATNALSWGSGFVYIDGKADTDLWSSLSSLTRRFGRDDDLLVLNYMTGNSDERAPSNTMNPFSSGSASYLSNMLVTLMPDAEGDNAMWKERAVSLMMSVMPALTWKRDNQDYPLSVNTIRESLNLDAIIRLSRDEALPAKIREGLVGYLDTLPGYIPDAFDDEGREKPPGPDTPMVDTTTVRQQHGYLTMQFTRSLQSLGDDYGYIFDADAADIDMVDIVLNRRMVVVLIPALEKSGDETANLGKIVSATLKGMMGSTLGSTVEGSSETVIENKPTHSSTPFMTIFDEVGYYAAQGMAVMAAQARSLGFCLVFASQDLQSMERRVKEEAKSITANCNIKIFGKLQDPTQTREFFEESMGKGIVAQVSAYQLSGGVSTGSYVDTQEARVEKANRADYDDLVEMQEGEAIIAYAREVIKANIFYSNPGHAKAMRVGRYVALPPTDEYVVKHASQITKLRDKLANKTWTATNCDVAVDTPIEIKTLNEGFKKGKVILENPIEHGMTAVAAVHALLHPEEAASAGGTAPQSPAAPATTTPPTAPAPESAMDTIAKAVDIPPAPAQDPAPQTPPPAGGPMGFFKKDDNAASGDTTTLEPPAAQPPTAPQAPEEPPPAQTAAPTTPPASPIPQTPAEQPATPISPQVESIKQQLSDDVERVLKGAGDDLKKNIFKSDDDN